MVPQATFFTLPELCRRHFRIWFSNEVSVYQLKWEHAERPALNYNNKESYGQNIYIKPMFYIQCNRWITRNCSAKTSPAVPQTVFIASFNVLIAKPISVHMHINSQARAARQSGLRVLILIMRRSSSLLTDYSHSPPHHQSYSSQSTSYGFKCIGNRSICINIHLFFPLVGG